MCYQNSHCLNFGDGRNISEDVSHSPLDSENVQLHDLFGGWETPEVQIHRYHSRNPYRGHAYLKGYQV